MPAACFGNVTPDGVDSRAMVARTAPDLSESSFGGTTNASIPE